MPILESLNSPHSTRVLKILVLVALLLFIAAIFIFWFGGSSFSERDVELKLEGPETALSGDEVTYKIVYENKTRTDLKNLRFRFTYPDHSIVIKGEAFSSNLTEEFEVASLGAGQSAEQEFRAFLVGDKGSILYAKVEMTYKAGGLNSQFEKKPISMGTTIVGMPVPITLSVPPTAVSGQEITYTLDYRNDSQDDISDLRFTFAYPEGFTPKRFSPQPSTGSTVWNLPILRKSAGNRITITGTLTGSERDNKLVTVKLQRKMNNVYIDYERSEASTLISSPLLNTSITANGTREYTASPGDQMQYVITFRNRSTYTFNGLSLQAKLEGEMFDFSTLSAGGAFFDDATDTLIWNAASAPELASLRPSEGGNVQFSIRLKQGFSGALGSKNFFVKTTSTLITTDIPTGLDGDEISTQDSLITKISTEPAVSQTMYYNDVSFGATGSLPPQVGTETAFTIRWAITNPGNTMTNTVLKATLPTGITWKNVVSTSSSLPQPIFNPSTSQITWSVGTVPSGIGVTSPKYDVAFQVSITPSSAQRGSTPTLIRNGTLTGTDAFTSQNIILNLDNLTTGDTVDRSGQGTVQ